MIYGKEKLFEAIVSPQWEIGETDDELLLYNQKRDRRLSYTEWGEGHDGVYATLGLYALNEKGEWIKVFSMKHFTTSEGEKMAFVVLTRSEDEKEDYDRYIYFDTTQRQSMGGGVLKESLVLRETTGNLKGLLYDPSLLPKKLDYEMTANLFVQQMIEGEMVKPVLVPEGLFSFHVPSRFVEPDLGVYSLQPGVVVWQLRRSKTDVEDEAVKAVGHLWHKMVDDQVNRTVTAIRTRMAQGG